MRDLPVNARKYLDRLEELFEVPIILISVGPDRDETIVVTNPFLS
jgi:adenylosuccinate synthase